MSLIIRIGIAIALLITLVIPPALAFNHDFIATTFADFFNATSPFVNIMADFFDDVRGFINYALYSGLGTPAVLAYNTLIKIALFFPTAYLLSRSILAIKSFLF